MKIGYPCINTSLGCTANRTFRLASYSPEKLKEKIKTNLDCLSKILRYNKENGLLFFRIGSGLIPFASHPICRFNWQNYFKKEFAELGAFIKKNGFRISTHPGHFTLINSPSKEVVRNGVKDLIYHCQILDLMGLDNSHKVQIHVGGVYGDRKNSAAEFVKNFKTLPELVKVRLVIENDEKNYSARDCVEISWKVKIPVLFDTFHHEIFNNGESVERAFGAIRGTWGKKDGVPMLDYSSQDASKKIGAHAASIDLKHFRALMKRLEKENFDLMIEIKDKEKSALRAFAEIKRHMIK